MSHIEFAPTFRKRPIRHVLMDWDGTTSLCRAGWGELLRNGAQMYEYQPTMYHCKVLVIDGLWTSVGSTNFDNRSFRLNDEANLNVHDRDFALRQIAAFNDDLKHSRRVTYEEWLARPWTQKVWQKALTVFNTQL